MLFTYIVASVAVVGPGTLKPLVGDGIESRRPLLHLFLVNMCNGVCNFHYYYYYYYCTKLSLAYNIYCLIYSSVEPKPCLLYINIVLTLKGNSFNIRHEIIIIDRERLHSAWKAVLNSHV